MRNQEGDRTPEMRRGRERLTVRNPRIEMALAGLQIDNEDIAQTRQFGNAITASVARWQVGRIGNSLPQRLDKASAARLLRIRLAALKGGA